MDGYVDSNIPQKAPPVPQGSRVFNAILTLVGLDMHPKIPHLRYVWRELMHIKILGNFQNNITVHSY